MRKIVLSISISVDGFFEGPNREIDWHLVDEELHTYFNEQFKKMGGFLDGRVTWELMADFWPTADADPASPPAIVEFAGIWKNMPKIVYSRTLQQAGWNTTIVRDVLVDDVLALKAQPGGDLAVGGPDLAATFRAHDLIDEYWLFVHPVLLGRGKALFAPEDARMPLDLIETKAFGNGVVMLRYQRPASNDQSRSRNAREPKRARPHADLGRATRRAGRSSREADVSPAAGRASCRR